MKDGKNKLIFGGVGFLVGMALIFYLGSFVVPKALVTLTRASGSAKISIKNSFLIGEKILASADGKEKCIVNVFVLDDEGKGLAGKQVQLTGLGSLNKATDSTGKATFELTSTTADQYELKASIGGATVGKALKVTFR